MKQSATTTIYRSCPTCEASCGLKMEVDQLGKQVISIKGDERDHRSGGYVCATAGDPAAFAARIKAETAQYRDGERLLDMMLRIGPYGDGFGANPEGLTLAKVKQHPHGLDLGPLQAMLPSALRTGNQRISLVHPLLEADFPRLEQALKRGLPELVMVGRRHIRDMNSWLHNIVNYARGKNRCTLLMNPADLARHGLADGEEAEISTALGTQILPVTASDEMMPGVVSFPHGFGHVYPGTGQTTAQQRLPGRSANDLIGDTLDQPSGTSAVNGVPVRVSRVA